MLHPSTKKLIDRLVEMTSVAKIDWQEGDAGAVTYTTEGYSVTLEQEPNELVITSVDGRELERASAEELAEATDGAGTSYTLRVAEMTREAVRKAKGIDTAISTLLAGIDTDGDGVPDEPAALAEETSEEPMPLEDSGDESAASAMMAVETEVVEEEGVAEAEDVAAIDEGLIVAEEISVSAEATLEPESDMTEAVARLADEVNGREEEAAAQGADTLEDTPSASNKDTTSDVALGATESTVEAIETPIESTEPVFAETGDTETVEAEQTEETEARSFVGELSATAAGIATTVAMAEVSSDESRSDSEEPADEDTTISASEDAPVTVTETGVETEADEPVSEPVTYETAAPGADESVAEAYGQDEAETDGVDARDETVESAPVDVFGEDGDVTFTSDASQTAEPSAEASFDQPEAIAPLTQEEAVVDSSEEHSEATVLTIEGAANDDAADEAEDLSITGSSDAETVSSQEPEAAVVSSEAETPNTLDSEISLSAIGAGFGLGALQVKGEASGVPGPASGEAEQTEAPQDTILIDATDEVPLSDVSETSDIVPEETLPEVADLQDVSEPIAESTEEVVTAAQEEEPESSEASEEDVSLTPRTRFNPWT
jgi:hypothetical protein